MSSSQTKSKIFVKTLKKCDDQVIVAIRNNLKDVAWFLDDKEIIPHNLYKRVTNPKTKANSDELAAEVHVALMEKVEEVSSKYQVFLDYIRKISPVTATMLDEAYAEVLKEQGGTIDDGKVDGTTDVPTGATGYRIDDGKVDGTTDVPTGATGGKSKAAQRIAGSSTTISSKGDQNEAAGGGEAATFTEGGDETAEGEAEMVGPSVITVPRVVEDGGATSEVPDQTSIIQSDHEFKPLAAGGRVYFGLDLKKINRQKIDGRNTRIAIIDGPQYYQDGFQIEHKAFKKPKNYSVTIKNLYKENVNEQSYDHALICTSIAVGEPFLKGRYSKKLFKDYPGGIAPRAKATVFLVDNNNGLSPASISAAIDEVIAGDFHVLSMSFGSKYVFKEISKKLDQLKGKTILVAAAGNSGNNYPVDFPARHDNVIAVGSLNCDADKSSFSAKNDAVDIYYSGEVMAPCAGGTPVEMEHSEGTSMATPGIAGLACLIMQCAKKHGYEKTLRHKKAMLNALQKIIEKDSSGNVLPKFERLTRAYEDEFEFVDLFL